MVFYPRRFYFPENYPETYTVYRRNKFPCLKGSYANKKTTCPGIKEEYYN